MTPTFDQIAVALKMQANVAADHATDLSIICHRIGLTPKAAQSVVGEPKHQAELISEAYRIIRGLVHVEGTIRAIIGEAR